jgi:hypothetical protein
MAGPNAGGDKVSAGTGLSGVVELFNLIGGQRTNQTTTLSPADISGLQALQTELQGADYTALLESIFNQARGAVPGISAGYGRTMGRTYGNAQMQAALAELLKQTTLTAQKQIADQRIQNQQIQANVGANIANATRGTTQTTTSKTANPLGTPVGALLLLQTLNSLGKNDQGQGGLLDLPKRIIGGVTGALGGLGAGGGVAAAPMAAPAMPAATVQPMAAAPVTSAPAQGFGFGDLVTAATTPVQAGLNALGGFLENPVSTATNLITAPIEMGLEGLDWLGEQVQGGFDWLRGLGN